MDDIVTRRKDVETRAVPEGALLVHMQTGRCFRLNRVGAEIWGMLEAPAALRDVCGRIAERYGRPIEQINSEVQTLVDQLAGEQLLEPTDPASVRAP